MEIGGLDWGWGRARVVLFGMSYSSPTPERHLKRFGQCFFPKGMREFVANIIIFRISFRVFDRQPSAYIGALSLLTKRCRSCLWGVVLKQISPVSTKLLSACHGLTLPYITPYDGEASSVLADHVWVQLHFSWCPDGHMQNTWCKVVFGSSLLLLMQYHCARVCKSNLVLYLNRTNYISVVCGYVWI